MKKVISNDELRKVILEGVNMISDAVSSTLGPSGNNVLINRDDLSPFITNDGVTIAESISSSNKEINTILEIVKEASLKTNELVGDGTTTTLVLLQSIYTLGLKEIINGKNPIELKNELNSKLKEVIKMIGFLKRKANKKDLINIASISSNSKEIGEFLTKLYLQTNNINIEEGNKEETSYIINTGYNTNINELNNVYFQDKEEIELNNTYILLLNGYLNSLEEISNIINEGLNNKNILIICNEYNEVIKDEVAIYYLKEHRNIFITSISEYGKRCEDIIKDIEYISNSKIKNINYDDILWSDLGLVNKVIIKREELTIINNKDCKERINILKEELKIIDDDYDKEFINNRISKLGGKNITILVGGITDTEIKEKKMRYIDALCALNASKEGILIGEGITLLKVSNNLSNSDIASKIIKKSLEVPFIKIITNSGLSYLEIFNKIKDSNYELVYNILENRFESINNTKIIDPYLVTIEALKNAISIAGMLLTTNYLVINDND